MAILFSGVSQNIFGHFESLTFVQTDVEKHDDFVRTLSDNMDLLK